MIARAAQIAAWLLLFGAAILTLGPRAIRPHTGIQHDLEHALAFALIGLAFGLGYPRYRIPLAMLAITGIGLMEIVQHWIPGRHANVRDFAVNALGACFGIAAAIAFDQVRRRVRRQDP
jgi:VanZ family protein